MELVEVVDMIRNSTFRNEVRMVRGISLYKSRAVHPGMMIKPELEERGISQKDFAKMVGIQASLLSEVLNGKRTLTTDLAVKIESAIGLPAKILLSAQTQYELESAKAVTDSNEKETIAITIPIRDRNLLREIVRRFGWVGVF